MKELKSKRVPVLVENETYSRFREYSEKTGVSTTHAVHQALNDWMETVGRARMETFRKTTLANLVVMKKRAR